MALIRVLASIALMIASGVVAAPWDVTSRHTTHRVRSVGPSKVKLTSYHPPATFEAYGVEGVAHPLAKRGVTDASSAEAAKSFLEDKLGVKADALSHKGGHASEATSFEYFRQSLNGIPVANAVANVALKGDKVTSFGASFVKPKSVAAAEPKLTKEEAISKAENTTGAKYNDWPTSLEYFAKDSDHVVLTHVVQVRNAETSEWYEIFVDANSGEVVNVIDFVSDASYRVVPLNVQDPEKGYSVQTDPADTTASPNGWHQTGSTTTSNTSGNNVISYKAILLIGTAGTSSQSSATNNYDYAYNSAVSPTTSPNVDAARVNAFYVGNMVHDLTYKYGFTEAAYNFQNDNYGKGGTGNDRVKISVQDWTGSNNANFATPADGQSGQMRMYTWTYTTPNRDGALENDIVVHEYGHGVSNRLTGGGTGRCLQTTEAGGMGEGWSDALAGMTEINSAKLDDFTLGAFVTGIAGGIRSYPYSTSKTTNPLTYGSLATLNEVHDIGEVWALIWHEITASLLSKYGYTADKFDSEGTGGNIKAMHLFINAFKLQPCSPTFLTARDAIIQADADKYGGENKCLLWQAFAKRGLGSGATSAKVDNTQVPSGC
ncbi:extracellular metalloproteinase MEP [Rhizoctonia solani]|uniref:Extracellular metalloproteinase n=1 Tax=Rhizoctonia solani TaxID=456999 RepID=A0A8H7LJH3_9AGAM|nr:extracellular metalloproteinase MEP [Rhizoctonia solani]KAF8671508.1 Fungalysin metallopeptidase (M36) [Rhizoctonia solani]QRW21074.1 extracellular metalloproteinase MEP [Rhizoctonia solani]